MLEEFSRARGKVISEHGMITSNCTWHPATIVIVQDEATRAVLTGASKPLAIGIPALERAAYNLTAMRLGKDFRQQVDICSEKFEKVIQDPSGEKYQPSGHQGPAHRRQVRERSGPSTTATG